MAVMSVYVNNVKIDAAVVSKAVMSDLWASDAEYSDHSYTKGTSVVFGYSKDGCITYSKRPGCIMRKQWSMGICVGVSVCEFTQLPTYQEQVPEQYPF